MSRLQATCPYNVLSLLHTEHVTCPQPIRFSIQTVSSRSKQGLRRKIETSVSKDLALFLFSEPLKGAGSSMPSTFHHFYPLTSLLSASNAVRCMLMYIRAWIFGLADFTKFFEIIIIILKTILKSISNIPPKKVYFLSKTPPQRGIKFVSPLKSTLSPQIQKESLSHLSPPHLRRFRV